MRRGGAFTVLLLLTCGVSAGAVSPPTNVRVICENVNVRVTWRHSEEDPNTSFRVRIRGDHVNTSAHDFNLTSFLWASQERFTDIHYVTVTAVRGGEESDAVESQTFSFNTLKTATTKCRLRFPPVDLRRDGSGAAVVSFANPLSFYPELKRAKKPGAFFDFNVSGAGEDLEATCSEKQEVCKQEVVFPAGAEECVEVRGWLYDGNRFSEVQFNKTTPVCTTEEEPDAHMILLIALASFVGFVVATVTIIICKNKVYSLEDPHINNLPTALRPDARAEGIKILMVSETNLSKVCLIERNHKSPSVSSEDQSLQGGPGDPDPDSEPESDPDPDSDPEPDLDLYNPPGGFYTDGRLLESSGPDLEVVGSNHDSDSVGTSSLVMDLVEEEQEEEELKHEGGGGGEEEEVERSPYEPR